jgi:dTDP-4-dehydrorhamnose 3,5-epimerase
MQIEKTELQGSAVLTPRRFGDDRGFFTERFRVDKWREFFPHHTGFLQDNYSWSQYAVLRGLHFQSDPAQGKLVTCMSGSIVDVIVDIRTQSPTFGKHLKFNLNGEAPIWVWVPPGFAHGFIVTSPQGAGVLYKVDQPYTPSTEGSIRWSDADLAIDWGIAKPLLSGKDAEAPSFSDYRSAASF